MILMSPNLDNVSRKVHSFHIGTKVIKFMLYFLRHNIAFSLPLFLLCLVSFPGDLGKRRTLAMKDLPCP
jgi:hypothetical protein